MNTPYRQYRFEDFARDERFRKWVIQNDPESAHFWEEWLVQNPDCEENIRLAKAFLWALEEEEVGISLNESELDLITEEILAAPPRAPFSFWNFPHFRLVASVLLVLAAGLGIYTYFYHQDTISAAVSLVSTPLNDNYLEHTNRTTQRQQFTLEDGSTVILYPQSRIRYPKPFQESLREVFLDGQAFFEIVKNPQKPFWVHTQYISTQVLGTSFMVNAFENAKDVQVKVKTGRVSVYTRKDLEKVKETSNNIRAGVVLTPNQQVAYSKTDERLLKSIVESPEVIVEAPKKEFVFEETPIAEVFEFLEKIYGISVIYDAKNMEDCYLTANLTEESLFNKLDLICKITHSTYEMVDAQVIIHSKGCK